MSLNKKDTDLLWLKCGCVEKPQISMWQTEHFTIGVKDNNTTKTANIKLVVLQSWHVLTRTRTIAMFYLKYKIVRTCDFFHYLTATSLETLQRISVTKVTITDIIFI